MSNFESANGVYPMAEVAYQQFPFDCTVTEKGFRMFLPIMPLMEQPAEYNGFNIDTASGGVTTQSGNANARDVQGTALFGTIGSNICPSDLPPGSKASGSCNHYPIWV